MVLIGKVEEKGKRFLSQLKTSGDYSEQPGLRTTILNRNNSFFLMLLVVLFVSVS